MKNILVPKEMLEAFKEGRGHQVFGNFDSEYERGLEAALRWLSDNPVIPTGDQIREIFGPNPPTSVPALRQGIKMLQQRMFLTPDPEVRQFVKNIAHSVQGVTLTEAEFGYLMDFVDTHGVDRSKAAYRGRESK